MDFIVKLPRSKEPLTGAIYDSIWVTMERLTKYAYMIPYKEGSTADELAYMFTRHIYANHGLPDEFITDRDKLFVSKFWKTLMAQLGVHHKLSSAYHPQTDGQTERTNQTLEAYLRTYVNNQQNDWVEWLPLAQFAFNDSVSEATQASPFMANYGYQPQSYKQPRADPIRAEKAIIKTEKLIAFHKQLQLDINFRNERMAFYANKSRSQEPSLEKGGTVYLLRKNIKTTRPSNKLDYKKLGPFKIAQKIGNVNYRLDLPKGSRVHPVFHVSLLEPTKGKQKLDDTTEVQPEHEQHDIYDVEKVLDSRVSHGTTEYFIKWLDWDSIHNTWELSTNLNCPEKLAEFHRWFPMAPKGVTDQRRTRTSIRKLEDQLRRYEDRHHWKA